MNRNLFLLVSSQVFGFTAATVTVFISGIIGAQLSPIKTLSTLSSSSAASDVYKRQILFVALILDRVVQGKKRV